MNIDISYDEGLARIAEAIEENLPYIIEECANEVCEGAKSRCPVDTGRLRGSINVRDDGDGFVISADTEYASDVEFGTAHTAPQPYLVPSLIENTGRILSAAAGAISQI